MIPAALVSGGVMTQQYIVGELSSLIGDITPLGDPPLAHAVSDLRRRVERSPYAGLPVLVREAIAIADVECWRSLERGDIGEFKRESSGAAALYEFGVCALLLGPSPG